MWLKVLHWENSFMAIGIPDIKFRGGNFGHPSRNRVVLVFCSPHRGHVRVGSILKAQVFLRKQNSLIFPLILIFLSWSNFFVHSGAIGEEATVGLSKLTPSNSFSSI